MEVYRDKITKLEKYNFEPNDDIFELISNSRKKEIDSKRFFIEYMPKEFLNKYDLNNPESLKKFRRVTTSVLSPLKLMAGYNMHPSYLNKDIRYAGTKISDPTGEIYGLFDIRNKIMTYSPIFPHFYEERDLIKFANDRYFTTSSYEEIILQQINIAKEYYIHTDNYHTAKEVSKNGSYVLEKISKDQMLEFALNPKEGAKVRKKFLNL